MLGIDGEMGLGWGAGVGGMRGGNCEERDAGGTVGNEIRRGG